MRNVDAAKLLEVVRDNRSELQAAGEKAYKEAMYNTHLEFKVDINEDGEINEWYQAAGSNSTTQECWEGKAINVITICKQYYETPHILWETLAEKLEEKGIDHDQVDEEAEEAEQSLYEYMSEHYLELIQEIEEELKELDIAEYGPQEVEMKIDQTINDLEETI